MNRSNLPPNVEVNWSSLSAAEQETVQVLISAGQAHVLAAWPAPGTDDDDKRRFLAQAAKLHALYPGALINYYGFIVCI